MAATRILCIDDQRFITDALKNRIEQEPDLEWVGGLADVTELTDHVSALKPDVLLVDVSIPGMSALDALAALYAHTTRSDGAPVALVLATEVSRSLEHAATRAGAAAVLSKNEGLDVIIEAIRLHA